MTLTSSASGYARTLKGRRLIRLVVASGLALAAAHGAVAGAQSVHRRWRLCSPRPTFKG
jgi:hypothetical protein